MMTKMLEIFITHQADFYYLERSLTSIIEQFHDCPIVIFNGKEAQCEKISDLINKHIEKNNIKCIHTFNSSPDELILGYGIQMTAAWCLIWSSVNPLPPDFSQVWSSRLQQTAILGQAGYRIAETGVFAPSGDITATGENYSVVDVIDPACMFVPQVVFLHPLLAEEPAQSCFHIWLCYVASRCLKMKCKAYIRPESRQKQFLNMTSEEVILLSNLYLADHKKPKDWSELCTNILPHLPVTAFLQQINPEKNYLFTLGCQRSGTTWMNTLIQTHFPDVLVLNEEQSAEHLVMGRKLIDASYTTIAAQITFASANKNLLMHTLDPKIKFIIMIRNPLSICYSLMYNFKTLPVVWHQVQQLSMPDEFVQIPRHLILEWAINVYCVTTRSLIELIQTGSDTILPIQYRQAVQNPEQTLKAIQAHTNLWYDNNLVVNVKKESLYKYEKLTDFEQEMITTCCDPVYRQVLHHTRALQD